MMSSAALVPLGLVLVVRRAAVDGFAGAAQHERGLGVHLCVGLVTRTPCAHTNVGGM